jgi:hypothetical protein
MSSKSVLFKLGSLFLLSAMILSACAVAAVPLTTEQVVETPQPSSAVSTLPVPSPEPPVYHFIEITDVEVQVGVGSPIPVDVFASGEWPDQCSQISQLVQQLVGNRFDISILATPAVPDCPVAQQGLPFRITIPLNMSGLPSDTYTVAVNDVRAELVWPPVASEPIPLENLGLTIGYVGSDGNLWVADAAGGPPRQITSDAAAPGSGGYVVSYYSPKISSDGRFIAVRRDAGETVPEGIKYQFNLSVYDISSGDSRSVFDDPNKPPAGFAWKPGTHLLAYGLGTDPNYFVTRGEPNPDLATGIYVADMDTGSSELLVAPSNGLTLIQPVWSPDGRYLSFDEVIYMEGKGPFAYFYFETQQYSTLSEALGNYSWSPDGTMLAYDRMTYTATGSERIFTRLLNGSIETQVSPEDAQSYAFLPVYSPDGSQLAYLVTTGGPDSQVNTLVVQDLTSGEVRELGIYESVWNLDWSSDGRALVFAAGPHGSERVYTYDLVNSLAIELAPGTMPTLAKP